MQYFNDGQAADTQSSPNIVRRPATENALDKDNGHIVGEMKRSRIKFEDAGGVNAEVFAKREIDFPKGIVMVQEEKGK